MNREQRLTIAQEIKDVLLKHQVSQRVTDAVIAAFDKAITEEAARAAENIAKPTKRKRGRPPLPTDQLLAAAKFENVDAGTDPIEIARAALRARNTLKTRARRARRAMRNASQD